MVRHNPLDEHIVPPSAFAIHADRDALSREDAGEGRAGELRALIGIDDRGLTVMSQGIFECLDAEARLHRDRQPPCQKPAAEPVEHDRQIDEAALIVTAHATGFGSMNMSRPRGICGSAHKANMPMLAPISITVSSTCSSKPCEYCPRLKVSHRRYLATVRIGVKVK